MWRIVQVRSHVTLRTCLPDEDSKPARLVRSPSAHEISEKSAAEQRIPVTSRSGGRKCRRASRSRSPRLAAWRCARESVAAGSASPWPAPRPREEADKARFGRELPLSDAARAALDSACPAAGLLFGEHDYREVLRTAARAAGIDELRAAKISDYDFRHSRATHLGQKSDNLNGMMYLHGWTQPATAARYMRPQRAAAEEVLQAAASGAASDELWPPTESVARMPTRTTNSAKKEKGPEPSENPGAPSLVRGGAIEPPWLLTASASTRAEGARERELGRFVRQEATGSGPGRPIPGTVPGIGAGGVEPDRVARELRRAMGVWRRLRDPVALRLAMERLLAMPELAKPRTCK